MTVNELNEEPRTYESVTREEHVRVFRSKLGPKYGNSLKLVYNGSIDAIKAGGDMVELKTRRYARGYHDDHFAKDLSCYLQSFLVGIADIYVGYHNDDRIVTRIERVLTRKMLKNRVGAANMCMHLLSDVLKTIRLALQNDREACEVRYADDGSKFTIHPALLAEVDFFKKN